MAIKLTSKPNTVSAGGDWPYGRIKDDSGLGDGTPVDTQVYGDFHQFFEKLMAEAGITHNDLPDNATNGFQLFNALQTLIGSGAWSDGAAPVIISPVGISFVNIFVNRYKIIGKTFYWEFSARMNTPPGATSFVMTYPAVIIPKSVSFNYKPIAIIGSEDWTSGTAYIDTGSVIISGPLDGTPGEPNVSFTLVFEIE